MKKIPAALRFVASIPFYAASVLAALLSIKPVLDAVILLLSGFWTAYRVGQVLGYLFFAAALATISAGLWVLGLYVRTAHWRKPAKPAGSPST